VTSSLSPGRYRTVDAGRVAGDAKQAQFSRSAPEGHLAGVDEIRQHAWQRGNLGAELLGDHKFLFAARAFFRGQRCAVRQFAGLDRFGQRVALLLHAAGGLVGEKVRPHVRHEGARLRAGDDAQARKCLGVFAIAGPVVLVPVRVDQQSHRFWRQFANFGDYGARRDGARATVEHDDFVVVDDHDRIGRRPLLQVRRRAEQVNALAEFFLLQRRFGTRDGNLERCGGGLDQG
jgi:hypothetical protein